MDLIVEITRSLYHLDLFRRSFRMINFHQCTLSDLGSEAYTPSCHTQTSPFVPFCVVCTFKDIFNELNLSMRESFLDPPLVSRIIEERMVRHMVEIEDFNNNLKYKGQFSSISHFPDSLKSSRNDFLSLSPPAIYDYIFGKLSSSVEKSFETPPGVGMNLPKELHCWKDLSNMKTEYSLTKICLECRTTTHIEAISQFIHQVDSSNLMCNDWPSFEFGLKSSLDSVEFCVKPNCHGQTKIFRCLRSFPDMIGLSFTDSSHMSTLNILPSVLRPYLVFESSTTTDISLKSLVLHSREWGYASLFYHSRLDVWIFIDKRRIVSLCASWSESKLHPVLAGYRAIVVFYCHDKDTKRVLPVSHNEYLPQPKVPLRPSTTNINSIPSVPRSQKSEFDRIYENWPVDSDSGQGSTEESSSSCSYGAQFLSTDISSLQESRESHLHRKPSTLSTNSSNSLFSSPDARSMNLSSHHRMSNLTFERTDHPAASSSSKNKFATIRRKCKYNSSPSKLDKNFSVSVPDLRSVPPTESPDEAIGQSRQTSPGLSTRHLHYPERHLSGGNKNETAILYSNSKFSYGNDSDISSIERMKPQSPTVVNHSPRFNESRSPKSVLNKNDLNLPVSSQSGVIFMPTYSNRKSLENSAYSSSKKVSFNCEVTLVNDEDDEYIPHPIFQSVIDKLNKM